MNFFVDTNIPVGYTIIHDKWHDVSKNFINNNQHESIYWSNLVKKEYNIKVNKIIDKVNTFLIHCKTILKDNQKDFVNYFDFENFLIEKTKICSLDKFKKQKILEQFWNKYNFSEGISGIVYLKFIEFVHEFEKPYHVINRKLKNILILHDCGLDNYLRYFNYAKILYDWGVHKPDCKIVADAHDCGKVHGDLIFISADSEMIEKIKAHNTSFLNILEFKSCN